MTEGKTSWPDLEGGGYQSGRGPRRGGRRRGVFSSVRAPTHPTCPAHPATHPPICHRCVGRFKNNYFTEICSGFGVFSVRAPTPPTCPAIPSTDPPICRTALNLRTTILHKYAKEDTRRSVFSVVRAHTPLTCPASPSTHPPICHGCAFKNTHSSQFKNN